MIRVFLGGTCNGSTWRDDLIPLLNVDYFNPVVKDWTPECMERERQERETCDLVLYVITPKMTGTYSIAEVVDDSNKRPEKTIFCPLRSDMQEIMKQEYQGEMELIPEVINFTDGQWKSIDQVTRMVKENGAATFKSIDEVAKYLNGKER